MSGSSEILAAIRDLQIHFEGQFHATNKAIQELHKSTDLWFDALQAGPLPAAGSFQRPPSPAEALAPAFSTAFRCDGSSSVPQQRRGLHLLSFDVTSAAASTSLAAAPTSAAVSTSFSTAPLLSALPAPPPSAVVSPPSPPSSAASPSPSAVAFPPSADSPLPLGSGVVLNRAGFAAPPPFLSPTTILAAPPAASGANLTARLEKVGCKTSDSLSTFALNDEASKDVDSPDLCKLGFFNITDVEGGKFALGSGIPGSPLDTTPSIAFSPIQVLARSTLVDQRLEINFWPSPLDTEAQAMVIFLGTDMLGHWWKYVLLGISRRSVIFSLYALEEVYKDIFESPP